MNLQWFSTKSLVKKILTSEQRVLFSDLDPYGHLNAAKYLEIMTNHRIAAAEDQIACHTLDLVKNSGVSFFLAEEMIRFLRPAHNGDALVIESWVSELLDKGFILECRVSNKGNESVLAKGSLRFSSVDARTGKPVNMPDQLPTRKTLDLIEKLPEIKDQ